MSVVMANALGTGIFCGLWQGIGSVLGLATSAFHSKGRQSHSMPAAPAGVRKYRWPVPGQRVPAGPAVPAEALTGGLPFH